MKKFILYFAFLCSTGIAHSQSWTNVGNGLDSTLNCLAVYHDSLVTAGLFTHSGSDSIVHLAFYDGVSWTGPDSNILNQNIYCMIEFHDTLFAASSFGIYYWKNNEWILFHPSSYPYIFYDVCGASKFVIYNDHLYFLGINYIYKKEAAGFITIGQSDMTGSNNDMCVYKNKLYVGGCFTNGIGNYSPHFACYNGTSWDTIAPTLTQYCTSVGSMAPYNGILYVSAYISTMPNIYFYQYDGTALTPAIDQPNGGIYKMDSVKGKLFIWGSFTQIGLQSINKFGFCDGTSWMDVSQGFSSLPYTLTSIIGYDSTVFIGGSFNYNNGINQSNYIARFDESTTSFVSFSPIEQNAIVYPNPAANNVIIESLQKLTIEILNIQGQTVLQRQIQQGKTDIDISGLAKGVYILRLDNNQKTKVIKILKE